MKSYPIVLAARLGHRAKLPTGENRQRMGFCVEDVLVQRDELVIGEQQVLAQRRGCVNDAHRLGRQEQQQQRRTRYFRVSPRKKLSMLSIDGDDVDSTFLRPW